MGFGNPDLAPEVARDPFDQLAGVHNRGLPPFRWKVALVAGDEVICAGRLSAFKKSVVGRVAGYR